MLETFDRRVRKSQPTQVITEDQRKEITAGIEAADFPDKVNILEFVKAARTILPPSRLVAIGTFPRTDKRKLYELAHNEDLDFLKRYAYEHEDLVKDVEGVLEDIQFKFFDPKFNIRLLAEDVVHAWVEHRLLYIGYNLKRSRQDVDEPYFRKDIERFNYEHYLKKLQEVQFQEPVYERYRNMLISQIGTFLHKLS